MSLNDPFNDLQPGAVGNAPGGTADGLLVAVAGTISFTTMKGTVIAALPVVAGQIVPCRVRSIEALGGGAAAYFGYHKA